jgi:hypothetical protein
VHKSWNRPSALRKLEIIIPAIGAAVGLVYLIAYISISVWQHYENDRALISIQELQMKEFSIDKGIAVCARAVNIGKHVTTMKARYAAVLVPRSPREVRSPDISRIVTSEAWKNAKVWGPLPLPPAGAWCMPGHVSQVDAKTWIEDMIAAGPSKYNFDITPIREDPLRAVVELVRMNKISIVLLGEVTYDVFWTSKVTRFCGIYLPDTGAWGSCPTGYDYIN